MQNIKCIQYMYMYNCVCIHCQARLQSGQTGIHRVTSREIESHRLFLSDNERFVMKYVPSDKHQLKEEGEREGEEKERGGERRERGGRGERERGGEERERGGRGERVGERGGREGERERERERERRDNKR